MARCAWLTSAPSFRCFFLLCVIVVTAIPKVASEGEVKHFSVLTDANFDQLTEKGRWVLEFYAPWCPHCQKLEPILNDAAARIKQDSLGLNIGTIDCTVQSGLASRFSVRGYPTLKYMTHGRAFDYNLGRDLDDFLSFARKVSSPAVTEISSDKQLDNLLQKNIVSFIAILPDKNILQILEDAGDIFRVHSHAGFAADHDGATCTKFGIAACTKPTLIMVNDDPTSKASFFTGPWTKEDVEQFVTDNINPIFSEISYQNWHSLTHNGQKTVVTMIHPAGPPIHKGFADLMKLIAAQFKKRYTFAWLDGQKFQRFVTQFGISEFPSFVVIDAPSDIYFKNTSIPLQRDQIIQFLVDVENGIIPAQGGGSGIWGKMQVMLTNLAWTINDHPYLFLGLAFFFVLFFVIVCLIDSTQVPEEEIEEEEDKPLNKKQKVPNNNNNNNNNNNHNNKAKKE